MATKSINKNIGGSFCAVSTCVYYYGKAKQEGRINICFHRFPKNLTYQTQWIQKCKRVDKWNPSSSFICSVHFSDDDFIPGLKAELKNEKAVQKIKFSKDLSCGQTKLSMEVEEKYKSVVQSYFKQRLFILMRYLNQHARLLAKKLKAKLQLQRLQKFKRHRP